MNNLYVNFTEEYGKVKPMHAINNGPVYKFDPMHRVTNMEDFQEAGIPYIRNHDASHFATYGGNHTVDVAFIFTDFDADPYDENSYDFACTDEYVRVCELSGGKTFYRLGSRIEHEIKKYNTLPPKDFHKWAVICEHIIKHYCYGWADGFCYDIEYWEIWNEPDLTSDDHPNKLTWGGTKAQFFEFYDVAATHLKKCFPEKKIGGPAIAWNMEWMDDFLAQLKAPLDFLSWHRYAYDPEYIAEGVELVRKTLDKYGFSETESILNEWNYIKDWAGEGLVHSIESISGLKGAAFTSATMLLCQNLPLDMLMYYDARPCWLNGLWAPYTYKRLKGYYPFLAFNTLYKLGTNVKVQGGENLYIAAAKNETEAAIMITHFDDDDTTGGVEFTLNLEGFDGNTMEYYLLDEEHDLEKVEEKAYYENDTVKLCHNAVMLIKIK